MDLRVTVTVDADSPYPSFKVGKTLTGLPLPIRCTGSIAQPQCGADADATRRLVARRAVRQRSGSDEADSTRAIDEKVPEQYRDAARSLLDLLNEGRQSTATKVTLIE